MDSLVVWLCNVPRDIDTITPTIRSIRKRYNWLIIVQQEPWSVKQYTTKKKKVIKNKKQLWCFKNHNQLIQNLLNTKSKYIFLAQDDFVYNSKCWKIIQDIILKHEQNNIPFWYYCFYTNEIYKNAIKKNWRNQIPTSFEFSYQVSHLFHRDILLKITEHSFYKNHLENYTKNKQVDACISEVCRLLWLPTYYHNPSLSKHIWASHSTIWHRNILDKVFRYFT